MNCSSLFSFGESSDWDPKEIRKRLIVSQDQLIKLNSIPGWTKVQDNQDTLWLDRDFSIGCSQFERLFDITLNTGSVENNTKVFDEQIENRKSILKTYKVYGNGLTRSLSLLTIDKTCENFNSKILKRTLSLQSVYQSSNAFDVNACKHIRCENSAKKHSPLDFSNKAVLQSQLEYILPTQCNISHSESQKNKELLLNKENSEIMETISQLPVNIPTTIEKPTIKENNGKLPAEKADQPIKLAIKSMNIDAGDLDSETVKKNNGVLPAENVTTHSDNMPDQPKHVAESLNTDKSDLHSETTKERNDINDTQCTNVSDEPAKTVNDTLNVNNSVTSLKNLAESCVPVIDISHDSDVSIVKEIPAFKISVFANEKATSSLNDQEGGKCLSSHLSNASETISKNCSTSMANANDVAPNPLENTKPSSTSLDGSRLSPTKSTAIESAKEVTIPDKEPGTEHLIENCKSDVNDSGSDMKMESGENEQKECDPAKYMKMESVENDQRVCEPAKSSADNQTSTKKRKLESRNKRSKKHKSERTLKIRSIKKVGEVCYSIEEVKTMLDIMKQQFS